MMKPDYSFQEDAVANLLKDFKEKPYGKFLLIIPTGGGKTITAMKTVSSMLKNNRLNKDDIVIWIVHLKTLKMQVEKTLSDQNNIKSYDLDKNLKDVIKVCMKKEAEKILHKDSKKCKLLVIDEAHHSAANSYKQFFRNDLGVLGLTATPTRTDDKGLDFDSVSYSISFRELVNRGVIIKPEFESVHTNQTINISSLSESDNEELNKFNSDIRNNLIVKEILERSDKYKKVIIFVGTIRHVDSLYRALNTNNEVIQKFGHIGYIYGSNKNDKEMDNDDYLNQHKKLSSSILVNCKLLNEGYDDPKINAIVMAVPTRSILYYSQCIGRVVRSNKKEPGYVLEFVDNLPNIKYKIDNKWLFADISDRLEPVIEERDYSDINDFKETLKSILNPDSLSMDENISNFEEIFDKIKFYKPEDISLLLFSANKIIENKSKWKFLIFTPENRSNYVALFNKLSNNIEKYSNKNHKYLFEKLPEAIPLSKDKYFSSRNFRIDLITALNFAYSEINANTKVGRLKYFIFTKRDKWPQKFLDFIKDCFNEEELKNTYIMDRRENSYIVKFPLPLRGYEGKFLNKVEFEFFKDVVKILQDISLEEKIEDHFISLVKLKYNFTNIPIPIKLFDSISLIVREELNPYYLDLSD